MTIHPGDRSAGLVLEVKAAAEQRIQQSEHEAAVIGLCPRRLAVGTGSPPTNGLDRPRLEFVGNAHRGLSHFRQRGLRRCGRPLKIEFRLDERRLDEAAGFSPGAIRGPEVPKIRTQSTAEFSPPPEKCESPHTILITLIATSMRLRR